MPEYGVSLLRDLFAAWLKEENRLEERALPPLTWDDNKRCYTDEHGTPYLEEGGCPVG